MDILGQDYKARSSTNKKWFNSAESDVLATLKRQIDDTAAKLAEQQKIYDTANANYIKCVQERGDALFGLYSCKNNTGETQATWKERANLASRQITNLKDKLAALQSDYQKAIVIADEAAKAGVVLSERDIMQNLSSQEEAKKYGIWIVVGLVAIAGGFIVYKKFIKRK